jgi:hypothetical protein
MTVDAALRDAAALNNALWCDAVCRAHGRPGIFDALFWATKLGAPDLYPDAVTLAGPASAGAQREAIASLINSGHPRNWAIKDSYAALDLSPLGFHRLFDAQWIAHRANAAADKAVLRWRRIIDTSDLAAWNAAWGGNASFVPALLAENDIAFLAAHCDDTLVGGAILNRGADVVGLSNVFAAPPWLETIWRELPAQVSPLFDDAMLVGYQSGARLDHAVASGFDILGPLRIWSRPATEGDSVRASRS